MSYKPSVNPPEPSVNPPEPSVKPQHLGRTIEAARPDNPDTLAGQSVQLGRTGVSDKPSHKPPCKPSINRPCAYLFPRQATNRKRTPNHPRGAYPLNHTADTPTCHCKHLPLAPKYH